MIVQCPLCPKIHNSDEHDVDWYFVCCSVRLVWRDTGGELTLEIVPEDLTTEWNYAE